MYPIFLLLFFLSPPPPLFLLYYFIFYLPPPPLYFFAQTCIDCVFGRTYTEWQTVMTNTCLILSPSDEYFPICSCGITYPPTHPHANTHTHTHTHILGPLPVTGCCGTFCYQGVQSCSHSNDNNNNSSLFYSTVRVSTQRFTNQQ